MINRRIFLATIHALLGGLSASEVDGQEGFVRGRCRFWFAAKDGTRRNGCLH